MPNEKSNATPKVFESEYRLCLLLWDNEPIKSGELAKLAAQEFGWKKSTTYTVIKRLTERGVLQNQDSTVTSLVTREEVQCAESREFLDRTFGGSLPNFIAAFANKKQLSPEEAAEIRRIIDSCTEESP